MVRREQSSERLQRDIAIARRIDKEKNVKENFFVISNFEHSKHREREDKDVNGNETMNNFHDASVQTKC